MKTIPDGSINMILCDLPYGTTQCKWDIIIPFDKLWEQYKRIIKTNGAIVLFGTEPFSSSLRTSNLDMYKYDWVWRKPKGTCHLNAKKQPMRDTENISVFYKRQCLYNPQMSRGSPYKDKAGKNYSDNSSMTDCYGKYTNFRNDNSGFRYPKTVIEFNVVERNTLHPTQKPIPLCEYLIKTYTNEGDTVLDNCMGSGTTGVAAKMLNRRFVGIEIDEEYFNIAKKRILST